jgi:hypothetical protein
MRQVGARSIGELHEAIKAGLARRLEAIRRRREEQELLAELAEAVKNASRAAAAVPKVIDSEREQAAGEGSGKPAT